MRNTLGVGRRIGCGLVALCLLLQGCGAAGRQKAIGYAYTGPATLNLRADLGQRAETTATVEHGERLEILETKRRFLKVRTTKGVEGWTDSAFLLTQAQMDELTTLSVRAARLPSQGLATVFDTLNVHTAASRTSPSFTKLEEDDKIDVLGRKVTARESAPADDWFLVRSKGAKGGSGESAGWVLSRMVLMLVPDEVTQYAAGHYIMSYAALGEARNPETGEAKTTWLWTTAAKARQPFDYDSVRVFAYNWRRGAYDTVFAERNLRGHYPVITDAVGFSIVAEEPDGVWMRRRYQLVGNRYKLLEKVPEPAAEELPEVSLPQRFDTKPRSEENWLERARGHAVWWLGL